MAERRPRVVYWFNQPTPYVVSRFNAVADRGDLGFEAWFSEVRQPDRSWDVDESSWRFPARYIPPRRVLGVPMRAPLAELKESRPDLLVLEYDRLNLAVGAVAGRAAAARLAFRALPNFDAWSDRTWWREAAKHLLFRAVDGVKVPGPDGAALAGRYGAPADRITTVTQGFDTEHFARATRMAATERQRRRAAMGLRGFVFLYAGRLWSGKGVDELLEAYRSICSPETSLLLVGDGVDELRYRSAARDIPGVVFAGFVQPTDLPGYYALADAFVFPTHGDPNGLVVEEALAAGLPVVSSDAAGDIFQRIPPGMTDLIYPCADTAALAHRMQRLLADGGRYERVARSAQRRIVTDRSAQRFAADFSAFVGHVLAAPARRSLAARGVTGLGRLLLLLNRSAPQRAESRVPSRRARPPGSTGGLAPTEARAGSG